MTIKQSLQAFWDYWQPRRRKLKKFLIADGQKHPVAIICPGGGYFMCCSFLEGEPYARALNKKGYSAVVLYYRTRKAAQYPTPMEDLAWAVREVMSHAEQWQLDVQGYSVWGSSAGGHLAASFGTENMGYQHYDLPKPGAIILTYPVITMGDKTHLGSRENLLGRDPTAAEMEFASVERQANGHYPPTFLWYGEADTVVPPENSRMLYDVLQKYGVPCELHHYPDVPHGVGLGEKLPCAGWIEKAMDFWETHRKENQNG